MADFIANLAQFAVVIGLFLGAVAGLAYVLAWLGLVPDPDIKFEIDHSAADHIDPEELECCAEEGAWRE